MDHAQIRANTAKRLETDSPSVASRNHKITSPSPSKITSVSAASVTSFQLAYNNDQRKEQLRGSAQKQFLPHSLRSLAATLHPTVRLDDLHVSRDPLPFQTQHFKSSTFLKMVHVPKRHQDMFADKPLFTINSLRKKAMIMHSERYQWDDILPEMRTLQLMTATLLGQPVRMSQREKLNVNFEEALRSKKRDRELLPHRREPRDLLHIGGQKAPFEERFVNTDDMKRFGGFVLPTSGHSQYRAKAAPLSPHQASVILPSQLLPLTAAAEVSNRATFKLQRLRNSASKERPKKKTSSLELRLPKIVNGKSARLVITVTDAEQPENAHPPTVSLPESSMDYPQMEDHDDDAFKLDTRVEEEGSASEEFMSEDDPPVPGQYLDVPLPQKTGEFRPRDGMSLPLKGADLSSYNVDLDELHKVFRKLDTDADGHLTYPQVRSHFSASLTPIQEKFVKQIYDITSATTFFGVQEFIQLKCFCDELKSLSSDIMDSYFPSDLSTLSGVIVQSVELFENAVNRSGSGHISVAALEDIVSIINNKEKDTGFMFAFQRMTAGLMLDSEVGKLNKIAFLALIPYLRQLHRFYQDC